MKKYILQIVFFIFFAPFAICFSTFAEEGVTDTEIHIGSFGPLTGPAMAWGAVVKGTGLVFNVINEEGGINGRKIVYHPIDDAYTPAKTKFGVKQMQESVGIFAWVGGIGTETCMAVKDYISNRNIIWFAPFSGSKDWISPPNKYIFAAYPLLSMESAILSDYAVKTMGKTKIAMVYQNDRYGKGGLDGAVEQLTKLGKQLILQIPVEATDSNLQPYALSLQKAEADAVLVWLTPFAAMRLLQAAKIMKYEPQWMGGVSFSDFPQMHKISKGMWTGMIATNYADYTETPQIKKYKEAFKKYGEPGETWTTMYHIGTSIADPLIEVIKRCGKNLTKENLVNEIEKLNSFKGGGQPITFKPFNQNDPDSRMGTHSVNIIKCKDDGNPEQLVDSISLK